MRFSFASTVSGSGSVLRADADEYVDGVPPVGELRFDTVVQNVDAARLAIAGCVAFGAYVGQEVLLKSELPRMTQTAISEFFSDRNVVSTPVTDVPVSVWPSAGTLYVTEYDRFFVPPITEMGLPHDYYAQVADGVDFNGAVSSAHQLIVASNANMLQRLESGYFSLAGLHMAIGVLLSRDLHMRAIHITTDENPEFLQRCRLLLRSAELNLSWSSSS